MFEWLRSKALYWGGQIAVLICIVYGFYWLIDNTIINLARQGTASGFGFLDDRSGFGISQTLVDYSQDSSYGRVLLVGFLNTLLVAGVSIFFATLLGFVVGIGRLSRNWLVRSICTVYIEVFRNVPLLLQVMFWYFGVLRNLPSPRQAIDFYDVAFLSNRGLIFPAPIFQPGSGFYITAAVIFLVMLIVGRRWQSKVQIATGQRPRLWTYMITLLVALVAICFAITGWPFSLTTPALAGFNFKGGINLIPEFVSLALALIIYTASFIAEIVRAGILSVDRGQTEAARALALPRSLTMRLIIIPQALRVIIPPLTSQYLNLTKNSSLAVAIAYPDIVSVFAGTTLNQVGQAVEIIFITMIIYLTLSLITSFILNQYNSRLALRGAAR
jgi:general L-amino acid transport system permease protein